MNTDKIQQLKAEINSLLNSKLIEQNLPKIHELEAQIKDIRLTDKLTSINREQERKRNLALLAYNAEQPDTDITTNDGKFHATKVKKYPNLAALEYCHAKYREGKYTELTINGHSFSMYQTKHQYNKPTEYTRPATFQEFLQLNSITEKDITLQEFKNLQERNTKINAEFQAAIEKFDQQKKELEMYFYSHIGLFRQENAGHTYQYSANIY
jgi:hypothetical protein